MAVSGTPVWVFFSTIGVVYSLLSFVLSLTGRYRAALWLAGIGMTLAVTGMLIEWGLPDLSRAWPIDILLIAAAGVCASMGVKWLWWPPIEYRKAATFAFGLGMWLVAGTALVVLLR